ncbi:MAG: MBL fold metallo-hydrolase [Mycolicibacterium sp.]|nr:MBL fold metallo-hydrolase [Mycolicibacterium sp.]
MAAIVEQLEGLPVRRLSRWCFNCYLITGEHAEVVVDPFRPRIVEDLTDLLTGRALIVTATHGHPDHISGAPALAIQHDGEVHLPATTLTYLDGDAEPRTPNLAKLARTWPVLFGQPFDTKAALGFVTATSTTGFGTSRGMLWKGPAPAGGLDDGAPLPGAPDWTVIATPGHTDDSIALWHNDSRTLISGDAVITMRKQPRFAPDTVDEAAAARTAARLRTLPVEHLLPGHGHPIHAAAVLQSAR